VSHAKDGQLIIVPLIGKAANPFLLLGKVLVWWLCYFRNTK